MNRNEVIKHLCQTVSLVYNSIGDYTNASDGFCHECPNASRPGDFRHEGITLDYVRDAVKEKLAADGFTIDLTCLELTPATDLGPQKSPASLGRIDAQSKCAMREYDEIVNYKGEMN